MDIPAELRYSKEHEWVRIDGDLATVGITDYAQDQLGDIVYLDLPAAGAAVAQHERMGEIESVKAVSDLFSPISGEVVEVNQGAVDSPELVNQAPYGRGWLLRVRLRDPGELESLLSSQAYDELITREMEENTD
ncbi:MAG: glycine cleavage system protein H [Chloroflexi bacterium RBG_16_68_14]|nr:MAG: glycine cleavage system protein H [Chloroflexi bacterium RBG_16_68_14]